MDEFKAFLWGKGLSGNTVAAYVFAAEQFLGLFERVDSNTLESYRMFLTDTYSAKTTNLRINGINSYLELLDKTDSRLKSVRVQQKPFLENVISKGECATLLAHLEANGDRRWYFAVRFMMSTGARVSELLKLDVADVRKGHIDILSKGNKLRRIYIPTALQRSCLTWLADAGVSEGALFRNSNGTRITARGLSGRLKAFALQCGVNPDVVYPHSFRHRFAKNFLEKSSDIAFLADLMGHESLETTRIYLRKTSSEQREAVDSIIDW